MIWGDVYLWHVTFCRTCVAYEPRLDLLYLPQLTIYTTPALNLHNGQFRNLSILNSTWSMFIQWIRVILSGDNLTYQIQKESVLDLPACDKPYHTNKRVLQKWEKFKNYSFTHAIETLFGWSKLEVELLLHYKLSDRLKLLRAVMSIWWIIFRKCNIKWT